MQCSGYPKSSHAPSALGCPSSEMPLLPPPSPQATISTSSAAHGAGRCTTSQGSARMMTCWTASSTTWTQPPRTGRAWTWARSTGAAYTTTTMLKSRLPRRWAGLGTNPVPCAPSHRHCACAPVTGCLQLRTPCKCMWSAQGGPTPPGDLATSARLQLLAELQLCAAEGFLTSSLLLAGDCRCEPEIITEHVQESHGLKSGESNNYVASILCIASGAFEVAKGLTSLHASLHALRSLPSSMSARTAESHFTP